MTTAWTTWRSFDNFLLRTGMTARRDCCEIPRAMEPPRELMPAAVMDSAGGDGACSGAGRDRERRRYWGSIRFFSGWRVITERVPVRSNRSVRRFFGDFSRDGFRVQTEPH
ncbi:hypothetical protein PIB30_094111 [Stylosanthes scabra]|uniref:Uncharacterized protein n=1 Tax=Stylosanthes scabra TaxID=79078 RepID=A0ABU6XXT4_9FABA|nr:hypothetical protein [Stylosanthes scabra]